MADDDIPDSSEPGKQPGRPPGTRVVELSGIELHIIGPLPPPAILEGYNRIQPDLAERVVKMAEHEQFHRHDQDRQKLAADIGDQSAGRWFALVSVGMMEASAAWCAYLGLEWAAAVVGASPIVGLATAFIAGKALPAKRK